MLYGAVDVTPTRQAPEFFKEVTAGLKQLQEERKLEEATEKAARASMGDPSTVNFANTWDSIAGAQQKAAQQLLEMKDELIKTEEGRALYQTYLDEIDQLGKLGEEDYKTTFAVANNNMTNLRTGVEYEGRMQDTNTLSFYENKMREDDNRDRYSVRFEGGHLVLDDGSGAMRFNDPRLFDATRYDAKLERMAPVEPDTFYRRNAYRPYITTRDQAEQAVQDELASSKRNRLDAIEWWLRNDPDGQAEAEKGLTSDKILAEGQGGSLSTALASYTDAAVDGWEKMTAEKKDKKDKKNKGSNKAPKYLDDGRFSEPEVSGSVGDSDESSVTAFKTYKETYTFPGDGFNMGNENMDIITYDTNDDPPRWVVTLKSGGTIVLNDMSEGEGIGYQVEPNSFGMGEESGSALSDTLDPGKKFDAKEGDQAFLRLLQEIKSRAVNAG